MRTFPLLLAAGAAGAVLLGGAAQPAFAANHFRATTSDPQPGGVAHFSKKSRKLSACDVEDDGHGVRAFLVEYHRTSHGKWIRNGASGVETNPKRDGGNYCKSRQVTRTPRHMKAYLMVCLISEKHGESDCTRRKHWKRVY